MFLGFLRSPGYHRLLPFLEGAPALSVDSSDGGRRNLAKRPELLPINLS